MSMTRSFRCGTRTRTPLPSVSIAKRRCWSGSQPGPMSGPRSRWQSGSEQGRPLSRCFPIPVNATSVLISNALQSRGGVRMTVSVYIPTPFRRATNDKSKVELEVSNVEQLLDELEKSFSGMKGLVRDEAGKIQHHVNVYVNNEAIDA